MSWILLTNDDGIDSPALRPFADALGALGDVRVVVPDSERSWVGKAITRYGDIDVVEDNRLGVPTVTVSGYPADAVQIGAVVFESPPTMVVSGINLGFNHGTGYLMASGTVGAAIEGWELNIPSYAFSAGSDGDWATWHTFASSSSSIPGWIALSALCVDLLSDIRSTDLAADVVNVNLPWSADAETPRKVTTVARVAYGQILQRTELGAFRHDYREDFVLHEPLDGTDVGVNFAGEIAITPVMMPQSGPVAASVRLELERGRST